VEICPDLERLCRRYACRGPVLFGDDYNSGANGKTNLPAEGDPPSSEISSAWLGYDDGMLKTRIGRQYVNLGDQRYFTSGLWRQNPQSFDAFSGAWQASATTTISYIYLDNAQRTVGHDYPDPTQREWSLDGDLIHLEQQLPIGKLVGYDYLVENDTQQKYSWRTAGLRWTGDRELGATTLNWTAEGAQQHSWRNNPQRYTADYHLIELSYGFAWASLLVGDEMLGGNGHYAFSSPYGSNHAFNGWTSQFKNVPANGLDDRYERVFGKISQRLSWAVTTHNFFAQRGSQRYGSESDSGHTYALRADLGLELDYASYHSNGFSASERELWVSLEYKRGEVGGGT
jgi:hypothetical protein